MTTTDADAIAVDDVEIAPRRPDILRPRHAWSQPPPPVQARPWHRRPAPYLLAVALLAFIAFGTIVANRRPAAVDAPPYAGRLLGVSGSDPISLQQLTSGLPDHTPTIATFSITARVDSISPDGAYVVASDGTFGTVATGAVDRLPDVDHGIVSSSFSPDGTRVAYTSAVGGDVVVYDLASKTAQVLFRSPCESYGVMQSSMTVCGRAESVAWIDVASLLVFHFGGAMPRQVSCTAATDGTPTTCAAPGANTYSIVTAAGDVAATAPGTKRIDSVRGGTAITTDGMWFDLGEVAAGTVAPAALPVGALTTSVSPDGTRVLVPGDPWRAVDLRTAGEQRLGTSTAIDGLAAPCVWSPDGRFVAVQAGGRVDVVPISADEGGVAGTFDGLLAGWAP